MRQGGEERDCPLVRGMMGAKMNKNNKVASNFHVDKV